MAYLYITVAVIVLFVMLHKLTELEMKMKVSLALGMFFLVAIFYFFEQSNTNTTKKKDNLLFAFNHGKDLLCDDKVVNNTLYNYASRSFIGKKNTKVFASPNIAIGHCIVKP